jgi:alpha-beta hydrolase superfamily lysophospholipase
MESGEFDFRTADGASLHVRCWHVGEPKAVVQVVHGIAEHGARYAGLAAALAKAGYTTYVHDHRGHGSSISEGEPPGHIADDDSWNLMVADTHAVNREIAGRHPGLPVIVLGHSMGSFILQQLLYEHPDDMVAAALSSSNGKPPAITPLGILVARIERARVGRRNSSPVIQSLTFGGYNKGFTPVRTEYDWLSRDPREVDAYMADPLCGFAASTQTWFDMLSAFGRIASRENVAKVPKDMPLYLFAGDKDPVGFKGAGMERLRAAYLRAGVLDVRLQLYPDGRHEMLNETNRDQVMADFVAWCDEIVSTRR